ncbi:MAG: Gmad2 immunoglobulin-like domain-containing protein [Lewinella sp.]
MHVLPLACCLICSVLLFPACGSDTNDYSEQSPPQPSETAPDRPYQDSLFAFQTTLPGNWTAVTNTETGLPRTINLVPTDQLTPGQSTPDLHGGQEMAYVLAIPDGLGTEVPAGSTADWESAKEWQPYPGFAVDDTRSQLFLLENDDVWGYLLYPASPPRGWSENGFVFAKYAVDDGETICYDANGQVKPPQSCDPMGSDRMVRKGFVSKASRSAVDLILETWEFIEPSQRAIDDLIRVDIPVLDMEAVSPLTVSGQARGTFYFEGNFTVRLKDSEGNTLAQEPATAQDDWMTEDWVPFQSVLKFDAPNSATGQVIFESANPSGLAENARHFSIPVRFGR